MLAYSTRINQKSLHTQRSCNMYDLLFAVLTAIQSLVKAIYVYSFSEVLQIALRTNQII